MKKSMIVYIITTLINNFVKSLKTEDLKKFLDRLIDSIETTIEKSDNKYDDALLPGLRLVRELFNIPDFPDQSPLDVTGRSDTMSLQTKKGA